MKKKCATALLLLLLIVSLATNGAGGTTDTDLYREAKVLIFDKKWENAFKTLDQIVKKKPKSRYYGKALFYQGKCLEGIERDEEAIKKYRQFIAVGRDSTLLEEANIAIVDLAFQLYAKGRGEYIAVLEQYLRPRHEKVIRYYAAFRLSYAPDEKVASKGIPVLLHIIASEGDAELRDRAKLALLRVNPKYIKEINPESKDMDDRLLHITVTEKEKREPTVSITISFALARIALDAFGNSEDFLKQYNVSDILKRLSKSNGEIVVIETKEGSVKLWIE